MKENKPRSVKELLRVMLDNQKLFRDGLCSWVNYLRYSELITYEERLRLNYFINQNKPTIVSKYSRYWFPKGEIQPRLDWINYHLQPTWIGKIKDLYKKLFM